MEKMGEWEKPQRPPGPRDFIPLEEISEEHVSPDWPRQLTPEELLIQEQEARESDAMARVLESRASHQEAKGLSNEDIEDKNPLPYEDPLPVHEYEEIAKKRAEKSDSNDIEEPGERKQKFKAEKTRVYSKQGREEKGKHQKGGETTRKFENGGK